LQDIYRAVNPSVVHIQVLGSGGMELSGIPNLPNIPGLPDQLDPESGPQVGGEGSGFVWDREGHIVTNNHVVEGATDITVIFADDTAAEATLVGTDPDSDLAVIKVDLPADGLQPVTLGDSTTLEVGELAIAIGNPFGQEGTMTVGIISALGRLLQTDNAVGTTGGSFSIPDIIQTDAAINPGNSGGVLLNGEGEVVGVTTAIISPQRVSSGIGLAVPSAIVQQVVPVLISEGSYEHPYLGISATTLNSELAEAMGLPADQRGALVSEVVDGSPAADAGLQASTDTAEIGGQEIPVGGDVITAADGQPVDSIDDLIAFLARSARVGQTIELTILRDGQEQRTDVTLEARPQSDAETVVQSTTPSEPGLAPANGAWLGILGAAMTPDVAQSMDLPDDQSGILVIEVQPDSPAEKAGLQGGTESLTINGETLMIGGDIILSVNGTAVTDTQELRSALAQYEPGDQVTLELLRDGGEVTVEVTLAERPLS
jgi:S1-C subfamily serine protease